MALIKQMPSKDIVDGFRGVLDFYTWCNLNIVRSWPRAPGRKRAPGVAAAGASFAYINKLASTLPDNVIEPYKELAIGTGLTWKDFLCRLYINASIEDHPSPPETIVKKEMYVYWNDDAPLAYSIVEQNVDIPWTVFDLTAFTSENAKFAILWVSLTVGVPGTAGDTIVSMRKNGTAAIRPYLLITNTSHTWARAIDTLILGLDDERKIEGKLALAPDAASIYLDVAVLGYIE